MRASMVAGASGRPGAVLKIGIVPALDPRSGGMHQYSVTMLEHLRAIAAEDPAWEIVVFASDLRSPVAMEAAGPRCTVVALDPPNVRGRISTAVKSIVPEGRGRDALRRMAGGPRRDARDLDLVSDRKDLREWFLSNGVDLMVYPAPLTYSFEAGVPFVMAIHDLQHRLQPEFPEVSADGEWETREYLFRNAARRAVLLLADSETGADDIIDLYGEFGVTRERVGVLPFLAASYIGEPATTAAVQDARSRFSLPPRFLFYPAQFWPHKNHVRLVAALGRLRDEEGLEVPLVLTGSASGGLRGSTFEEAMAEADRAGVRSLIHWLGYVDDREMAALYRAAEALVMPTFFGPTNIPVVEAWASGCAVVTSDVRGIREQVGDAGVLVDPRSEASIAEGILRVWTSAELVRDLVRAGHERLRSYTPEDYRRRLAELLRAASARAMQPDV